MLLEIHYHKYEFIDVYIKGKKSKKFIDYHILVKNNLNEYYFITITDFYGSYMLSVLPLPKNITIANHIKNGKFNYYKHHLNNIDILNNILNDLNVKNNFQLKIL